MLPSLRMLMQTLFLLLFQTKCGQGFTSSTSRRVVVHDPSSPQIDNYLFHQFSSAAERRDFFRCPIGTTSGTCFGCYRLFATERTQRDVFPLKRSVVRFVQGCPGRALSNLFNQHGGKVARVMFLLLTFLFVWSITTTAAYATATSSMGLLLKVVRTPTVPTVEVPVAVLASPSSRSFGSVLMFMADPSVRPLGLVIMLVAGILACFATKTTENTASTASPRVQGRVGSTESLKRPMTNIGPTASEMINRTKQPVQRLSKEPQNAEELWVAKRAKWEEEAFQKARLAGEGYLAPDTGKALLGKKVQSLAEPMNLSGNKLKSSKHKSLTEDARVRAEEGQKAERETIAGAERRRLAEEAAKAEQNRIAAIVAAAEEKRLAEEARVRAVQEQMAEQERMVSAEQKRLEAEERRLAEEIKALEEKQHLADEALARAEAQKKEEMRLAAELKAAEEKRLAEEARIRAEAQREEEDRRLAAELKAAEEKRLAEEAFMEEEEKRLAAERKALEEKRLAEEAEERRVAAELKAAEEKRLAEEARIRAEEQKAEDEKRVAAELKAAEEKRVAEEARIRAEELKAEEERRVAAELKAAEEKRLAEEARTRAEAQKAEEERRAAAELKAAEEKRLAEEARIKAETQKAEEEERRAALERKALEEKRLAEEELVASAEKKSLVEEGQKAGEKSLVATIAASWKGEIGKRLRSGNFFYASSEIKIKEAKEKADSSQGQRLGNQTTQLEGEISTEVDIKKRTEDEQGNQGIVSATQDKDFSADGVQKAFERQLTAIRERIEEANLLEKFKVEVDNAASKMSEFDRGFAEEAKTEGASKESSNSTEDVDSEEKSKAVSVETAAGLSEIMVVGALGAVVLLLYSMLFG